MIRIFSIILLSIISCKANSNIQGEVLICNKDRRGYNFIKNDIVEVSSIDHDQLKIVSIMHSYELTENKVLIKQTPSNLEKEKSRIFGWIFRKNLDYVSLDYINGDWVRKFLWTCEVSSSKGLETKLKNKLNVLKKANKK